MKTILTLALALGLLAGTGTGAAAASCTDDYVQCLDDTTRWWAPLRIVADIVCFDDYTACVYWSMMKSG